MLLTLLISQDGQTDRNSDRLTEDALSKFMGTKTQKAKEKKMKGKKRKKNNFQCEKEK